MINFEYQTDLEKYFDLQVSQFNDFKSQYIDPYTTIEGKTFLEIGYGASTDIGGSFMSLLHHNGASSPIYGIDTQNPNLQQRSEISAKLWNIAKEKYNLIHNSDDHYWGEIAPPIIKLHMNSEDMYFKNDLVDVIYSTAVLEHIKRPDLAFKEMFRVLKPGGIAIHAWNPFSSLTMGGHDIGIPFYYPWAHLRLKQEEHIQKLKEVFFDDNLRNTASVPEHTLTLEHINIKPVEDMYKGVLEDLNKIRIKDICKYALDAGFTILAEHTNPIETAHIDKYLTDEIRSELSDYTEYELVCSSHRLILSK